MTTHYIDIHLLPDPEFSHAHLLGALVAKLHRALVHLRMDAVGVSYPQHVVTPTQQRSLGSVVRLHGSSEVLEQLMALGWLQGMRDHTQASALASAPAGAASAILAPIHGMARAVRWPARFGFVAQESFLLSSLLLLCGTVIFCACTVRHCVCTVLHSVFLQPVQSARSNQRFWTACSRADR